MNAFLKRNGKLTGRKIAGFACLALVQSFGADSAPVVGESCVTLPAEYISHYISYGAGRPTKNRLRRITCEFDASTLKHTCRSQPGLSPSAAVHHVWEFRSLQDFRDEVGSLGVEKHLRFTDMTRGVAIENRLDAGGRLLEASFWKGAGRAKVIRHDRSGRPLQRKIFGKKCAGSISTHRYDERSMVIRDRLINFSDCSYVSRRRAYDGGNFLLREDLSYRNGRKVEIENTLLKTRKFCN